jgi:hypothetical protein
MRCGGRSFSAKAGGCAGLVKGKRWLLLTRWVNMTTGNGRQLNQLFALNRKLLKTYLLKESLDRLWTYAYEGAMVNYFKRWMDQLRGSGCSRSKNLQIYC